MRATMPDRPNAETDREMQSRIRSIPGYEAAIEDYVLALTRCMAEIDQSRHEAPLQDGVPPVKEIVDRHETTLREKYAIVREIADRANVRTK